MEISRTQGFITLMSSLIDVGRTSVELWSEDIGKRSRRMEDDHLSSCIPSKWTGNIKDFEPELLVKSLSDSNIRLCTRARALILITEELLITSCGLQVEKFHSLAIDSSAMGIASGDVHERFFLAFKFSVTEQNVIWGPG